MCTLTMNTVSAYVLAGGHSKRFRSDKALQNWHGKPLLAHVVASLADQFQTVYVIGRRDHADAVDLPVIADVYPGCGPLGGIHAGLCHTQTAWNFFAACDMPWIQPQVVSLLLQNRTSEAEAVVPEVGGWWVPTLALYHRGGLDKLESALTGNAFSVQDFLKSSRVEVVPEPQLRRVDAHLKSFVNLNTLEAWQRAARVAQDRTQ